MLNAQHPTPVNHLPRAGYYPDHERVIQLNHLADGITALVAHLDAGTYQLLELIGEFDRKEGWAGEGIQSCAHWLNWKCGMSLESARERVRVARALPELPRISAVFREGKVSYSKVRAMTRVATKKNEAALLQVAMNGTATHVETQVRLYRKTKRIEALEEENLRHGHRELSLYIDDDGYWVFKGRFTPEQGALLQKALEAAGDQLFEEQQNVPVDVATEIETLKEDGSGAEAGIGDRGHVPAETCRRLACDCSIVHWQENQEGEPLNIGRKTRSIPPAIRRALKRRDQGCRFPGCTCSRFVDAHHIQHWADGGETSMDNLVLLCRTHHRLVHEAGYGVRLQAGAGAVFSLPGGKSIPQGPDTRSRGNVFVLHAINRKNGLKITSDTSIPQWYGDRMDNEEAVDMLLQCE